jgi:hypothetical protein
VKAAEAFLDKKTEVCDTMQDNRGLPSDLLREAKQLKKGESTFQRKNDILLQVWKDKREMGMISLPTMQELLVLTNTVGQWAMSRSLIALFNTQVYERS